MYGLYSLLTVKSKYAKAVVATLIAIATALTTALGASPQQSLQFFTTQDWLTVIAAILASGAVTWWVTNVHGVAGGIIKAVVGSAGALVTALITAYADNVITQGEVLTAATAALIALVAVYENPNTGGSG